MSSNLNTNRNKKYPEVTNTREELIEEIIILRNDLEILKKHNKELNIYNADLRYDVEQLERELLW